MNSYDKNFSSEISKKIYNSGCAVLSIGKFYFSRIKMFILFKMFLL